MEELVLILGTVYAFVIGYIFVYKADKFIRKNPKAFPGRRGMRKAQPADWRFPREDECWERWEGHTRGQEDRKNGKGDP